MKKIIILIATLLLILLIVFLFFRFGKNLFNRSNKSTGPVSLTYWGLWEDDNLVSPLISEFEKQNPNIKVNYLRQSSVNYRTRVQTQIREGQGPDVFMIHNSWLVMFASDIFPAPKEVFTMADYRTSFYPVTSSSFVNNNQIFAAPKEIDGLGLFYNEDILKAAGVTPPKTWKEFQDDALKMTVADQTGSLQTAGAALGTTSNVDHWSDILGLLLLQQPGVNLTSPASQPAAEVLNFYTGFVKDPRRRTWDKNMPPSTQAFEEGRLAFYFGPSWRAHEIHLANPNLKFKVAPVPQLPGSEVAWASFWAEAVSIRSSHPVEAWQFVKFLTSKETEKLAYSGAAAVRLFGEPYSRVDLGSEVSGDPLVGAFVNQGPIYKFWYLSSNTLDAGINDEMIKYWEDAINATLGGTDAQVALQTVDQGTKQIIDKYTKVAPAASGQKK